MNPVGKMQRDMDGTSPHASFPLRTKRYGKSVTEQPKGVNGNKIP
jgi:hypothetical protein